MGSCQSNSSNSSRNDDSKVRIDVAYCGGNTVKPYFEGLVSHLQHNNSTVKDAVLIKGRQDLRHTGRFDVYMYTTDGKKKVIHSKKQNKEDGWARRPEERYAIENKIHDEVNKRRQNKAAWWIDLFIFQTTNTRVLLVANEMMDYTSSH